MKSAVALADQIDESVILAMDGALTRGRNPDQAGQWRAEQVWIGGVRGTTEHPILQSLNQIRYSQWQRCLRTDPRR